MYGDEQGIGCRVTLHFEDLYSVMRKGRHMTRKLFMLAATLTAAFPTITCAAQTTWYGDWQADLGASSTITEAFTTNQSGSIFGFICSASVNRCMYYISTHTTCDLGSTSTILISTDAGALTSTITCTKFGDNYYNAIQNTNDLNSGIAMSMNLGIAMPMKSGEFKVVRFSLVGAKAATGAAAARVVELEKNSDHMQ